MRNSEKSRLTLITLRVSLALFGTVLIGGAPAATLDFTFRDANGSIYRSTQLAADIERNIHVRPPSPRALVVHAVSREDPRLRKQEKLLAGLDWENLQLLLVISLEKGAALNGYSTDAANSKQLAAVLGSFGVALLDASGVILLRSTQPVGPEQVRAALRRP